MTDAPKSGGRTDVELLRAHVDGDADAFSQLVHRHRDRLWAVALRTTGDPEEAADALQDALISAFRRAESFRGDAQVTTWLHRIVVNSCLDQLRRRSTRRTEALPTEDDRSTVLAVPGGGDEAASAAERRADVLAALQQLTAEQRAALVLVDMEGYSVEEAADILSCAPGTVKSRCSRGRAKLVPLLANYRRNPTRVAYVQTTAPSSESARPATAPVQGPCQPNTGDASVIRISRASREEA
ncbi:MAG: RNA polymerase sigma factor SigM [Nocardioidaceae bacterium]